MCELPVPSHCRPPLPPLARYPYHLGGARRGKAQPVPLSSRRGCTLALGKTCCLLLSAPRASLFLPLVVARAVGASLGRNLFSAESPASTNTDTPPTASLTLGGKYMTQGLVPPTPLLLVSCPFPLLAVTISHVQDSPHPQDCAPFCKVEPWVSSGFGHGVHGVGVSSLQSPGGFSLSC